MSNTSQIPLYHRITDPSTGMVTQPWAFWFQSTGTNSSNGANNVQVGLQADLPAASNNANSVYLAYDSGNTYVSSGTAWVELVPSFTGDVTNPADNNVLTLATVNNSVGTFGDPNNYPVITVDKKGRVTNVSLQAVTPGSGGGGGGGSATATTLVGDVTGSGIGTINTVLSNTGVVPGTYYSADVTIDAKGRITSASNGSSGPGGSSVFVGNLDCGLTTDIVTANVNFGIANLLPNNTINLQ